MARSQWRTTARLLAEGRPYWPNLVAAVLLNLLASPLELLMPLPLAMIVNSAAGSDPFPKFVRGYVPQALPRSGPSLIGFAIALLIVVALIVQLHKLVSAILVSYTGEKLLLS